MGLVSRMRSAAQRGAESLGENWRWNGPLGNAAIYGAPFGVLGGIEGARHGRPVEGALGGAALGLGIGGVQAGRAIGSGIKAGLRDFARSGAAESFERSLAAFSPRVQNIARALAPIKEARGEISWDDLDQVARQLGGPITPDELLDLKILFSEGHSVTMAGHR